MAKNYLAEHITTCISIHGDDMDHADELVAYAKKIGYTACNRSDLIRFALRRLNAVDIPEPPTRGGKLAPGGRYDH